MNQNGDVSTDIPKDAPRILIGITGGIAAYKIATLVSALVKQGCDVHVLMTEAATRFIGADTFRALTGNDVYTSVFNPNMPLGTHVSITRDVDLMVIAPATAHSIAALANGTADDIVSTSYLAYEGAVLLAPAMNTRMWKKPAVQRNINTLREDGVAIIGPDSGWLSCREQGEGRMSEPETILNAINKAIPSEPHDE